MRPHNFVEYLVTRFLDETGGSGRVALFRSKTGVDPLAADDAAQAALRNIAALATDRDERTAALLIDLDAGRDWASDPVWNDLNASMVIGPLSASDRLALAVQSIERGDDPGAVLWPSGEPTDGRLLEANWLDFPPMRTRLADRSKFALLLGAGAADAVRSALEEHANSQAGNATALRSEAVRLFDQYAAATVTMASPGSVSEATADLELALAWPATQSLRRLTEAA